MPVATQKSEPAPFIITTSLAKPDSQTRKLIRSHVMRGKNVGKFRRNKHWQGSQRASQSKEDGTEEELRTRSPRRESKFLRSQEGWTLSSPRKVASELALFGFATETEAYVLDLVYRAFTVVKPAAYGLQVMTGDSPQDYIFCFSNLLHHPGILHSTLFAAQAFHDSMLGQPYGPVAQRHLARALAHLQKCLDDQSEATELSTITVVTSLALAAVIAGDLAVAAKHMDGLHRIVELRGGLRSLGENSLIEHKARAIDIGLAIAIGSNLRFDPADGGNMDISWAPQLPHHVFAVRFPELAAPVAFPRMQTGAGWLDPRLLNVWADLREFSRLVNNGTKLSREASSELATSVPRRLLSLRLPRHQQSDGLLGPPSPCLHELLRLCMLAYAKMLLIKLGGLGKKMTVLADGLREELTAWHQSVVGQAAQTADLFSDVDLQGHEKGALELLLWGLFVGSISIFEDSREEWLGSMLREVTELLGLRTWDETRVVLKAFLWIDIVFDQAGERVFRQCCLLSS